MLVDVVLAVAFAMAPMIIRAQLSVARPPVPGAPAGVTALVNVTVVPMDGERVLPSQTVLVQHGWIIALGKASQITVPAGATLIKGRGKYLIPGLADMHAHLLPSDSTRVQQLLAQWLNTGVTTVRIMDNYKGFLRGLERKMSDVRAWAASGKSWLPWIYSPPNDHIKTYDEELNVFEARAARARAGGPPLMGHVPPRIPLEYALRSGMRSIEHLTGYISWSYGASSGKDGAQSEGDGTFTTPPDTTSARIRALAKATKQAGVWNTPTLAMMGSATSADAGKDTAVAMALMKRYVKELHAAGAGLLLGSDAGTHISPDWAVHRELELFVESGLTPYEALLTGTRNVAEFYGKLKESGTVAVGKRADLVLLRGNPLQDVRQTRQLAGVMIGGRWRTLP